MNRSLIAVLLVGSLVVQGTVAGVLVGGSGDSNATNTTATNGSISDFFIDRSNGTVTAETTTTNGGSANPTATARNENDRNSSNTSTPSTATESSTTKTPTATETAATARPTTTETATETPSETPTPTGGSDKNATSTRSPTAPATTGTAAGASGSPSGAPAGAAGGSSAPVSGASGVSNGSTPATASASGGTSAAAASGATGAGARSGARTATSVAGASPAAGGASPAGASTASGATGADAQSATGTTGASAVSPDADFEVRSVSSDVAVGEPGTVSVTIENTGEDATNAVVDFQSLSSDLLFGQSSKTSRFVGDWNEGENRTVKLTMRAASTADTAEYPVQATVSYDDGGGNASRSAPVTFGVTPAAASTDLSVVSVSSDVPVGGTGNLSVTLENDGADATNAVVNLQTLSGDLLFGRSPNTTRYVGDWNEGDTKTVEVTTRAARTADTSEYPVRASVSYEDDDGNPARLGPATFGVTPAGKQAFSLDDVSSGLQVGDSGTISGTVTNDGPKNATDAVLTFAPNGSRDVIPRQTQYVLGDLGTGDSKSFDLPVIVNATTEPGERQVPFFVQYYDADGTPLRSNTLNARVDIGEATDDFAVVSTTTDVESGGQGTLSVTMNDTGGNVTDATVSFQSLSGGVLFGRSANTTRYVQNWDTGDRRTFEFDVVSPESTGGETYPMQASVRYTDSGDDPGRAGPFAFGVTPSGGGDDFSVVSTASTVPVGDKGPISVTLENTGADASEAVVSLQSLTSDIAFGRAANATAFVGDWPAGARRTITVNATASNQSDIRSYPFQASVSYNNSDGDQARAGPFTVGITPQPQQEFNISNTRSTLRVGDEGNLTAQVRNEGPEDVQNAVVDLVTQSETLSPKETEVSVGSLGAGESKNVSFPIEVSDSAESGQRQFSFVVEYDNRNGDTRRSSTLDTQANIAGERNAFAVERANDSSIDAGSSGSVTLNVTNNLDSVVTNLDAKAFVNDPLSVANDEAYVAQLKPGETKQITFDVSASGGANPAQYPLSLDFQYDTPSQDSQLSQTYDVPVNVSASGGGGLFSSLWVTGGLAVLLVVLGAGLVWSRR